MRRRGYRRVSSTAISHSCGRALPLFDYVIHVQCCLMPSPCCCVDPVYFVRCSYWPRGLNCHRCAWGGIHAMHGCSRMTIDVEYARSPAVCIVQSCAADHVYGRKACLCRVYFGTG